MIIKEKTLLPASYHQIKKLFSVDRALVRGIIEDVEPLVLVALAAFGGRSLWQGKLPVYPIMTTPPNNGGWGHLMPMWFKPHERPIPFHTLDNWALFALVYMKSFGNSDEASELIDRTFTVDNLARVVLGNNLLLPFLPSTQGQGYFFRQGMLPFLLAILWLDDEHQRDWLRLHELGAEHFIAEKKLVEHEDPTEMLTALEFTVFSQIERNAIHTDADVEALLVANDETDATRQPLLHPYRDMFGAINLGVAALAKSYHDKPLNDWRTWAYQEISFPYRTSEYGTSAIAEFIADV